MSEKADNSLNLALGLPQEALNKSAELSVGVDESSNIWELIVRYQRSLERVRQIPGVTVRELSNGYAVVDAPKDRIDYIASLDEVIFIEKPKRLEFSILNAKRESCINQVQQNDFITNESALFGEGVIVGIADSGIDYQNMVFRNQDGTTRILKLWDQVTDTVFDETQINEALQSDNPYAIVNSRDISGHGTHVAGILAGNFALDKNDNLGIATKSKMIIVKMATAAENSFPRTTQLMEAVDFMIKEAGKHNMPIAINLSFGNTYGPHDGSSLLSTYIDSMVDGNRTVIAVGTGNEGDSAGHTGGFAFESTAVEVQVSRFQKSFSTQLWKDFSDDFIIEVEAPSGIRVRINRDYNVSQRHLLNETRLFVLYGTPKPYTPFQEVYMELIPENQYVNEGIWIIHIIPEYVVVGRYDMWLPGQQAINENTKFLRPDPFITLTIPSPTSRAIAVGAYDSATGKMATFSGRGFTRETNQVKPDIVAPGVNISSAAPGGGLTTRSGTSMATPFVTGSAALLMEWGIVRGNDRYMYGEKLKAYLIRGARHLEGFDVWPNPQAGWGALCLRNSLPG